MDRPAPHPSPPPLTRWQWTWRNLAALAFSAVVLVEIVQARWPDDQLLLWLDVGLGVCTFVAVQYRRRWPVPVAWGILLVSAFSAAAAGPAVLALISLATRRRWSEMLPAALLNVAAGTAYFEINPASSDPWLLSLTINILATGVAVAIGMYVGARRELVANLKDRAERAENEQALRVAQARSNERARIAREMHDVLAHRISLVAMHAGALEYRKDLSAEETSETAAIIQANAHRALTDLREILGVLRDQGKNDEPERPQPTLRDLEALVTDARVAGAHVRVHNQVPSFDGLPESVGRNAYRVIQETLTNVRKHAPNTTVDIDLSGEVGEGLLLRVSNPLPRGGSGNNTPGSGLGLIGLAERAELSGGRLEHEVTPHGHFVVRAWLPWPR